MPRHVPDDFSFLPTVDSTDDEIVEKQALRKAGEPPAHEEYAEPPAPEAPEAAWVYHEPSSPAETPPAESRHARHRHAPEQDGRALWEEFMQQDQPAPQPEVSRPPSMPEAAPAAEEMSPPAATEQENEPPEPRAPTPAPASPAPEVVKLRGKRDTADSQGTPPVSFGGTLQKEAKEPRKKAQKDSQDPAAESAAHPPDSKPFIAPKPPPEKPLDPETAKKKRWQQLVEKVGIRSLVWSVGAHVALLLIGAFVVLNPTIERQIDFLPGGGSAQSQAAQAALTNTIQNKKNPWLKTKPQMRKITVQSLSSDLVLPEMPMDALDMSSITNRMDISKASASLGLGGPMGAGTAGSGGGFGSGIGRGGKFSFVGQAAVGRRVVFVVDVSGSMSAVGSGESISRFDLLKKELVKSINQIPMNTQFQILFFSDFAWPHDQVDSRNVDALTKYRWEIDPKDYKKVKIPTFRFIQATPFSLRESADIIQKSDNPGGTNWGSGLLMALNANPKPDLIFFMTDGLRSDEQGWIDIVTEENKRRMPMTAIYTSAMQQPDAARELDDLARRNNGRFTVVLGDGKIVKGEDFFKMKR